jgi:hypothetical protein
VSVRHRQAGDLGKQIPLEDWIRKLVRLSAERAISEDEKSVDVPRAAARKIPGVVQGGVS